MMATHITTGRASALPLALISQAIPKLKRSDLEALAERLIDRLDLIDGDADVEDATDLEDDFSLTDHASGYGGGPGCSVSDAGGQSDEDDHNTGPPIFYSHGQPWRGPGCPFSDDDC